MLLASGLLPGFALSVPLTRDAALLIGAQVATFTVQFLLFVVLQKRGGPIYASLLGAVAATVGVQIAILLLREAAPAGLLVGSLLIAGGIAMVTAGAPEGRGKP